MHQHPLFPPFSQGLVEELYPERQYFHGEGMSAKERKVAVADYGNQLGSEVGPTFAGHILAA
jgi:hypothetical protein